MKSNELHHFGMLSVIVINSPQPLLEDELFLVGKSAR